MVKIKYTIEASFEVDAEDPQEISEVMEYLRGFGEAEITNIKLIEDKKHAS